MQRCEGFGKWEYEAWVWEMGNGKWEMGGMGGGRRDVEEAVKEEWGVKCKSVLMRNIKKRVMSGQGRQFRTG